MCLERAKRDKELEQSTSESQKTSSSTSAVKLPQFVTYPNYSQGQIFPRENIVLDRKIDNYAIPSTSSTSDSRSTPTVTASSPSKKTATTTSAEVSTSQGNQKEPMNVYNTGYNTSGSVDEKES